MTNPVGRPSKYDPSYCGEIVELGKQAYSEAMMADHFDVCRATLRQWAKDHEEFSTAFTRATTAAQAELERRGLDGLTSKDFNAPVWKTTMQARFRDDYTERKEVSGPEGGPVPIQVLTAVPRDTD